MTLYLLARRIKPPKPKPMIRIPDNVMAPYNAQVFIIRIKCQKNVLYCKFYIFQLYRQYYFFTSFQATIFFPSGFWSLYLPTTVNGRVSDIWRAYFSQGA